MKIVRCELWEGAWMVFWPDGAINVGGTNWLLEELLK